MDFFLFVCRVQQKVFPCSHLLGMLSRESWSLASPFWASGHHVTCRFTSETAQRCFLGGLSLGTQYKHTSQKLHRVPWSVSTNGWHWHLSGEDRLRMHNDKNAVSCHLCSCLPAVSCPICCHTLESPSIPTSSPRTHTPGNYLPTPLLAAHLSPKYETRASLHPGSPWTATIMKPHPLHSPDPTLPPSLPPLSNSQNPPLPVPHSLTPPVCWRPLLPPRITLTIAVYL